MATEREDDVSDEQESETDDCDTEEDEGKINYFFLCLFVALIEDWVTEGNKGTIMYFLCFDW